MSFTGSSIQGLAQGWFVYEITHDKSKLALVAFFSALPIAIIGPAAGTIADLLNKRAVLVFCQVMFGLGALTLAWLTYQGWVEYWHIVAVAGVTGLVAAIEMPTRQSIVSQVVPMDELQQAVPMQAMTFNLARFIGPSVGGFLLSMFGVATCYMVNGLSYIGMVLAVLTIHADLRATRREPQPVKDLLAEGARFLLRDSRLRVLFILECAVAGLAIQYIFLLPALAKDLWRVDAQGLAWATIMIGIGAITGLIWVSNLPRMDARINAIRFSILAMGVALILLATLHSIWAALPLLAVAGMSQVVQFNTTNTLFQLLSPPHMRGRVLAMHMWAMAGLSPMGALLFGWLSQARGLPFSLAVGGAAVLVAGIWAWTQNRSLDLSDPALHERPAPAPR